MGQDQLASSCRKSQQIPNVVNVGSEVIRESLMLTTALSLGAAVIKVNVIYRQYGMLIKGFGV